MNNNFSDSSDSSDSLKEKDMVLVFDFPEGVSKAWDNRSNQNNTSEREIYESLHDKLNEILFSVDTRKSLRDKGVSITRLNKHGQHEPGSYYYIARVKLGS